VQRFIDSPQKRKVEEMNWRYASGEGNTKERASQKKEEEVDGLAQFIIKRRKGDNVSKEKSTEGKKFQQEMRAARL